MSWGDDDYDYQEQSWWAEEDRIRQEREDAENYWAARKEEDYYRDREREKEDAQRWRDRLENERDCTDYETDSWDSGSSYSGRRINDSNRAAFLLLLKWIAKLACCWAAIIGETILQIRIVSFVLLAGSILISLSYSCTRRDCTGHGPMAGVFFLISLVLRAAGLVTGLVSLLALITAIIN